MLPLLMQSPVVHIITFLVWGVVIVRLYSLLDLSEACHAALFCLLRRGFKMGPFQIRDGVKHFVCVDCASVPDG